MVSLVVQARNIVSPHHITKVLRLRFDIKRIGSRRTESLVLPEQGPGELPRREMDEHLNHKKDEHSSANC